MATVRGFVCLLFALLIGSGGVQADNRIFLFPSGGSTLLTVLDAGTLKTVGNVPATAAVVRVVGVPDGSKYYVVANNPGGGSSLRVIRSSDLTQIGATVNLATNAFTASVSPDGKLLLVTAGTVKIFDTATDQQVADVAVSGPSEIEFTQDSARAYVLSTLGAAVAILDLTAQPPKLLNLIPVLPPLSMALTPDNKSLVLLSQNQIQTLSTRSNAVSNPVPLVSQLNNGKVIVAPDSRQAVVLNRGLPPFNVSLIYNLSTQAQKQIGGANQGFDQIVIADSTTAFGVVSGGGTNVAQISLADGSAGLLTAGVDVSALDISPSGQVLFLASSKNSTVTRLDRTGGGPLNQAVGTAPRGLSVVFPPPTSGAARIEINGGANQTVVAGQQAQSPLSVRVTTTDGSPVFGVAVNFSDPSGLVTFTPTQPSVTNSRGIAQAIVTAAPSSSSGVQSVSVAATAGGAGSVSFPLNITSGTGVILISGDLQIAAQRERFPAPLRVLVLDQNGFPPPVGTEVDFFASNGVAVPDAPSTVTDADGFAQMGVTARDLVSSGCLTCPSFQVVVRAFVPSIAQASAAFVDFTLEVAVSVPNVMTALNPDQTGQVGQTLVLQAQLSGGTLLGFIGVQWSVVSGPVTLGSTLTQTDGNGVTSNTATLVGASAQPIIVQAMVPGRSALTATFTLHATGGAPQRIQILQGDGQQGNPGTVLPLALKMRVLDALDSPVPLPSAQYPLNFSVSPANAASVFNFFQDVTGEASALVRLGNTPGPLTITFQSGSGVAVFNLRILTSASALVTLSGVNQHIPVGGTTPSAMVVRVIDSIGNGVVGVPVTVSAPATVTLIPAQASGVAAGGSALTPTADQAGGGNPITINTDSNGRAAFTARAGPGTPVGQFTITASFTSGTASASVSINVFVDGRKPVFSAASVVNAGSFRAGMVPYSLATIFGTGLSEISGVELPSGATTYKGVTIRIDGVAVPLYAISNQDGQEQINFQVRSDLAGTSARVEISNNGSVTSVDNVPVLAVQPGIFEYVPQGTSLRYAAALKRDGTAIRPGNAVSRGDAFSVFLTGAGVTVPILGTGQAGPQPPGLAVTFFQPVVGLNGRAATVLFSGVAPGFVGLYQINVLVPSDAPTGDAVNLDIVINGVGSQTSRIAVQ